MAARVAGRDVVAHGGVACHRVCVLLCLVFCGRGEKCGDEVWGMMDMDEGGNIDKVVMKVMVVEERFLCHAQYMGAVSVRVAINTIPHSREATALLRCV